MTCLDESSVVIPFIVSQNFTDKMGPSINLFESQIYLSWYLFLSYTLVSFLLHATAKKTKLVITSAKSGNCLDESSVVISFVVSQSFTDEMGSPINLVFKV